MPETCDTYTITETTSTPAITRTQCYNPLQWQIQLILMAAIFITAVIFGWKSLKL